MRVLMGIILILLLPNQVFGETNHGEYGGVILNSVIDARTIIVDLPEYPGLIGEQIKVRINGIQVPSLKGKCEKEINLAKKAKKFTENAFKEAEIIDLTNMTRGIYFQILADVLVNDEAFAPRLLEKGYAVKGSKKKSYNWCK